ncbi:MAG: IS3 family transposase, partial [Acidimicrobiales bacterium]
MASQDKAKHPAPRRYSADQKAQAIRLVRQLRSELGTERGTIERV